MYKGDNRTEVEQEMICNKSLPGCENNGNSAQVIKTKEKSERGFKYI